MTRNILEIYISLLKAWLDIELVTEMVRIRPSTTYPLAVEITYQHEKNKKIKK